MIKRIELPSLKKRLSISKDNQSFFGPGQSHIEPRRLNTKPRIMLIVTSYRRYNDIILLRALIRINGLDNQPTPNIPTQVRLQELRLPTIKRHYPDIFQLFLRYRLQQFRYQAGLVRVWVLLCSFLGIDSFWGFVDLLVELVIDECDCVQGEKLDWALALSLCDGVVDEAVLVNVKVGELGDFRVHTVLADEMDEILLVFLAQFLKHRLFQYIIRRGISNHRRRQLFLIANKDHSPDPKRQKPIRIGPRGLRRLIHNPNLRPELSILIQLKGIDRRTHNNITVPDQSFTAFLINRPKRTWNGFPLL